MAGNSSKLIANSVAISCTSMKEEPIITRSTIFILLLSSIWHRHSLS